MLDNAQKHEKTPIFTPNLGVFSSKPWGYVYKCIRYKMFPKIIKQTWMCNLLIFKLLWVLARNFVCASRARILLYINIYNYHIHDISRARGKNPTNGCLSEKCEFWCSSFLTWGKKIGWVKKFTEGLTWGKKIGWWFFFGSFQHHHLLKGHSFSLDKTWNSFESMSFWLRIEKG